MMLHIKFDQDWPTGFRDIEVQKREMFVTQRPVLVTSNVDDSIKNEQASMETPFFQYKSMGFF